MERKACIVCREFEEHGIYVRGFFICRECERAIVSTHANDANYTFLVQQLKQLWLEQPQG